MPTPTQAQSASQAAQAKGSAGATGYKVISIVPDRNREEADYQTLEVMKPHPVRRPTNGIMLKEDTFATLRLVGGDPRNPAKLMDGGGAEGFSFVYSNFLLQQIQEERTEKSQILETFGEAYIFLFGERARVISFSGVLMNTFDFNWEAEWWHNYDKYLRGTRCVENNSKIYLTYDETMIGGYIIGAAASKSSENKNWVNFQFQVFLTSYTILSRVGSTSSTREGAGVNGLLTLDDEASYETYRPVAISDPSSAYVGGQGTGLTNMESVSYPPPDTQIPITPIDYTLPIQPQLLANTPKIPVDGAGASINTKSLSASIASQAREEMLSSIQHAFEVSKELVGKALTSSTSIGSIQVSMPYGFSGSTTFEATFYRAEKAAVTPKGEVVSNQTTKPRFYDNTEEQVRWSGYQDYTKPGHVAKFNFEELANRQKLLDALNSDWLDKGFVAPMDNSQIQASAAPENSSGVNFGMYPASLSTINQSLPISATLMPPTPFSGPPMTPAIPSPAFGKGEL